MSYDYDPALSQAPVLRASLPEQIVVGQRLGRNIEHDPRSWDYPATLATTLVSVRHERHCGPFEQLIGSCTGNAAGGLLMTDPIWNEAGALLVNEGVCQLLYVLATRLDGFRGIYPPTDTGSSGLAVAKASKYAGLVTHYGHAFGIDQALLALSHQAVITGVDWHAGCDSPDGEGIVHITGDIRGGHEFVVDELDLERGLVGCTNSWGASFGLEGRFFLSIDEWDQLLQHGGDVTTMSAV